ncbi:MAG: SPOR domain-containing protein [Bacteroidales bacterium]|nr:SPOR domain-containing protein [Bacteroidales bacterium]
MKKIRCFFISILLLNMLTFVGSETALSQGIRNDVNSGWSLTANMGAALYSGGVHLDPRLTATGCSMKMNPGFGFGILKSLGSVGYLSGQMFTTRMEGKWGAMGNLKTDVLEFTVQTVIDAGNLLFRYNSDNRRISALVSAGIGLADWRTEWRGMYPDAVSVAGRSGTCDEWQTVIPVGVEMIFRMNHQWTLGLGTSYHSITPHLAEAIEGNEYFNHYVFHSAGIKFHVRPSKHSEFRVVEVEIPEPASPQGIMENRPLGAVIEEGVVHRETQAVDEPWSDVVFKVQLFASRTRQNTDKFARKHDITARIDENKVDGWFKYTVGEFTRYSTAKSYRNQMVLGKNVTDAFVVAYQGDRQVSLQELMQGKRSVPEREIEPAAKIAEDVTFSVQILAAKSLTLPVEEFKKQYGITEETHIQMFGDIYQLVSGNFHSYREAKEFRRKLIAKGLNDAFIVAYRNGSRIPIDDAYEMSTTIFHD